jgi:2-dehydro-3-deoxy-D-gluconate 5-dehydrogenase
MTMKTIAQLFNLSGKGAVVTGGAMGIGQGIAFRLAEAGAGVIIADISVNEAKDTVKQIESKGWKAKFLKADVCKVESAEEAIQAAIDAYGSIDILVNSAANITAAKFMDSDEALVEKAFNVNVKGIIRFSQAAVREMIKAKHGGKIINIASLGGLVPARGQSIYSATKAAVISLTKSMANELGPYGITANALAPGGVMTAGTVAISERLMKALGMSPEELTNSHLGRTPLNRVGEPDDMAKVVLFLASGASDFMTGSIVWADGGFLTS